MSVTGAAIEGAAEAAMGAVADSLESRRGRGWRLRWLLGLLMIAAAVRIGSAGRLPCLAPDGVFFVTFAKQIAENPRHYMREQKKQPGYSAMLLAAHRAAQGRIQRPDPLLWEACGQAIALAGGLAAALLIYSLTRRCFDAETGLAALALAAFWPEGVELSADVLSDMPHLALYLAGLLCGLRAVRGGSFAWAVACGLLGGAAYLTRQEGLGLPIAVMATAIWVAARSRGAHDDGAPGLRRAVGVCAIVGAAFALSVSPYAAATGKWMHNKTIGDLLFGPQVDRLDTTAESIRYAADSRGWMAPLQMADGWARSGRYVLSTWAIIGMAWAAVPRCTTTPRRLITAAVLLQIGATWLRGTQFGEISGRYMVIPAALTIPWAAAAITTAWRRTNRSRMGSGAANSTRDWLAQVGPGWVGAAIIMLIFGPMAYFCVRPPPPGARAPREAGAWLAQATRPGEAILTPPKLKQVAFYANREAVWPAESQGLHDFLASPDYRRAAWFVDRTSGPAMGPDPRNPNTGPLLEILRRRAVAPAEVRSWLGDGGVGYKAYRLKNDD